MITQFPEYIQVSEPIAVPTVRPEKHITHLTQNGQHDISPFYPIPSAPDYAAFKQPTFAIGEVGSVTGNIDHPRGVSIEPTSEYIFVSKFMRIQIFSHTGDRIHHFGSPHLSRPWGILVHQDNIFVTDEGHQAIFRFRIPDLVMIKKVGNKGAGSEEFNRPKELAISPNQHIYVADQYNNRIQILTINLEFNDTLKHQTMTNPCDVKFSNNEIFVLSFTDNPCIHVFTLSGEKSRSILNNGVEQPLFFCLDGHGNIVISEYYGRSIKVFSPEGQLLHTIGQKFVNPAELSYPFGITIHNNREVICVSSNLNYCLQIFSK